MELEDWHELLVGEYLDAAIISIEEKGYVHRLVRVNGNALCVTRDYRLDRIGLSVVDNKVVNVFIG